MNKVPRFIAILLIGVCHASFIVVENGETTITEELYLKNFIKYTSEHDIVRIVVPLNKVNFDESISSVSDSDSDEMLNMTIFFVEADIDDKGKFNYKGLYSFKNGQANKLLENGVDAAASADDSKLVFFGTKEGIYVYNDEDKSVTKYGSFDDNIISIAKPKKGDIIYIITDEHFAYKISEKGTKKEKLNDIVNAKRILLDHSDNIYFVSNDNVPYAKTSEGVKKIEGLPENPTRVQLFRPPFIVDHGLGFISDNIMHFINANGTSDRFFKFGPGVVPSAYGSEGTLMQYLAHDKKIYEYDVSVLVQRDWPEPIEEIVKNKVDDVHNIRSSLKSRLKSRN